MIDPDDPMILPVTSTFPKIVRKLVELRGIVPRGTMGTIGVHTAETLTLIAPPELTSGIVAEQFEMGEPNEGIVLIAEAYDIWILAGSMTPRKSTFLAAALIPAQSLYWGAPLIRPFAEPKRAASRAAVMTVL